MSTIPIQIIINLNELNLFWTYWDKFVTLIIVCYCFFFYLALNDTSQDLGQSYYQKSWSIFNIKLEFLLFSCLPIYVYTEQRMLYKNEFDIDFSRLRHVFQNPWPVQTHGFTLKGKFFFLLKIMYFPLGIIIK